MKNNELVEKLIDIIKVQQELIQTLMASQNKITYVPQPNTLPYMPTYPSTGDKWVYPNTTITCQNSAGKGGMLVANTV